MCVGLFVLMKVFVWMFGMLSEMLFGVMVVME